MVVIDEKNCIDEMNKTVSFRFFLQAIYEKPITHAKLRNKSVLTKYKREKVERNTFFMYFLQSISSVSAQ